MTQKKTAGKTAKQSKTTARNRPRTWHEYSKRVDGEHIRVLRSPAGRDYYGTAREVREAALPPDVRHSLAESIDLYRYVRRRGTISAEELKQIIASRRRDAIHYGLRRKADREESDTRIMIAAAARYIGLSVADFEHEAIRSAIESAIDRAISDGLPELPLTRHERAAMSATQSAEEVRA